MVQYLRERIFSALGLCFPEELTKIVRNIIDYNLSTNIETEEYKYIMGLFDLYCCSPEEFISWEDYKRFCESVSDDFFGII